MDTSQPDPDAALSFYGGLFGWEFADAMPQGPPVRYFVGRIRGGDVAAVGSIPEGALAVAMWNTYIWVDSVDETVAKAHAGGGRVVTAPFDVLDAGRMAVRLSEHVGDPGTSRFVTDRSRADEDPAAGSPRALTRHRSSRDHHAP